MQKVVFKCDCEGCELRSLFFESVETSVIDRICEIKIEKNYKKGDIIAKEGNEIIDFIYLKSGIVKLHRTLSNKKDQIINITKLFDFISLFSVFLKPIIIILFQQLKIRLHVILNLMKLENLF